MSCLSSTTRLTRLVENHWYRRVDDDEGGSCLQSALAVESEVDFRFRLVRVREADACIMANRQLVCIFLHYPIMPCATLISRRHR